MKIKLSLVSCGSLALLLATCGCTWAYLIDHAIVTDSIGVYDNPRLEVDPSFRLLEVDGTKVERVSTVPTFKRPIVRPGTHLFKAELHRSRPLSLATERLYLGLKGQSEITFKATVEAGKVYLIYWKQGEPALLEVPRR